MWNDLDYADEHHSIEEAEMLSKAQKAALEAAAKGKKDKKDGSSHKSHSGKHKQDKRSYMKTPMPWPMTNAYVTEAIKSLASGGTPCGATLCLRYTLRII